MTLHVLKGYLFAFLYKNGKGATRRVHRLVCEAFICPCPPGKMTNHKNGIRHDNRLENLEWVTAKENVHHSIYVLGTFSKLSKNRISPLLPSGAAPNGAASCSPRSNA